MGEKYPAEILDPEDDDGTIVENVKTLEAAIVGRKIVGAELTRKEEYYEEISTFTLTLDDGRKVTLADEHDCCAYTTLNSFLLNVENIDHIITGVGTTNGYTKWHIYADFGDVMEMHIGWSCGNPFYYGYGFEILVKDAPNDGEQQ